MIASTSEFEKAQAELQYLEDWLAELQRLHPFGAKGFTKAGVRRMIARVHQEMAEFEANSESREFQGDPNPLG